MTELEVGGKRFFFLNEIGSYAVFLCAGCRCMFLLFSQLPVEGWLPPVSQIFQSELGEEVGRREVIGSIRVWGLTQENLYSTAKALVWGWIWEKGQRWVHFPGSCLNLFVATWWFSQSISFISIRVSFHDSICTAAFHFFKPIPYSDFLLSLLLYRYSGSKIKK